MKTILRLSIVWLLLNPSCLIAQDGFIKTFVSPDTLISRIQNIVYSDDNNSLILSGIAQDRETTLQGIWLVKFDTLGNLLKDTIHLDSGGDDYPRHEFLPLITTSDGGYIYVTTLFFGNQIVVTKFDNNLEVVFSKILDEDFNEIRNPAYNNIFEVEDGFILHLRKQHINFKGKNHLVKIDNEGNFLWEEEYGDDNQNFTTKSTSEIHDGVIYISGHTSKNNFRGPYLFKVDLEGNLLEEHYFDEVGDLEVINWGPLKIDSENNIIAETTLTTGFPNGGGPESNQLEISKYAADYELIWYKQIGPDLQFALTDLPTITLDEEDNILSSGNLVADDGAANPSIIMKLSPDGETIWERRDTLFIGENDSPQSFSIHDTEKHIVLPSGSIVMVGTATPNSDHDAPQQGYIIKLDKDGCLESGCREVVNTAEIPNELSNVYSYPNPSSGIFAFSNNEKVEINVLNSLGEHIKTISDLPKNGEIDLSIYPNGIYYGKIKTGKSVKTLLLVKDGN